MLITVLVGITGEMRKTEKIIAFGVFCIILTFCLLFTTAEARLQQPYIIVGHVYDDSENKTSSVEVTLTNVRTSEFQTVTTNEKGEYLFECLNFKHGYKNGDKLSIKSIYGSQKVVVDTQYAGIQADINRPEGVDVEPIISGAALIAAGGLYYYLNRKKKKLYTKNKNLGGDMENMSENEEESLKSSLLSKGRISVWIILIGTMALGVAGTLTGDQVVTVVKDVALVWLGVEGGARVTG